MPQYENLEVYNRAMLLSAATWELVRAWPYFHKDTLGKQIVRAADSVPANIAESQGRYSFNDRIRFCHYSRGSLYEYQALLRIALTRDLVDATTFSEMRREAEALGQLLNGFIGHLRQKGRNEPLPKRHRDSASRPNGSISSGKAPDT